LFAFARACIAPFTWVSRDISLSPKFDQMKCLLEESKRKALDLEGRLERVTKDRDALALTVDNNSVEIEHLKSKVLAARCSPKLSRACSLGVS
jgi:hypothetical protein